MSRDGFSLNALTPVLPLQPGVCRVCRSWSFTSKVCDKCERWSSHLDGYVPPVLPLALAVEGEDLARTFIAIRAGMGCPTHGRGGSWRGFSTHWPATRNAFAVRGRARV